MGMSGFLHRDGRRIVDGSGKEMLLLGWGLGNLYVKEGYMWGAFNTPRFDRSRRIEQVIEELTGKEYARRFWRLFQERYIAESDFRAMREAGCNSVRIPLDFRQFMEEGEGIVWREEGFTELERRIDQCEQYGLYVFLDMHCAPGGQTGANIDNSVDDRPRLFMDADNLEKSAALWRRLAKMNRDREIVGGYDLLNEPLAPGGCDHLMPVLEQHYRDLIRAIREVDANHLLSIEGAHWATDLRIFRERFDENMALHFHRYAGGPDLSSLQKYLDKAEEMNLPLWLGESGENDSEWYAALYPLSLRLGIGVNLWPWKKLNCANSPYSIRKPKDYDLILGYVQGGPHPGFARSRRILDEYLENVLLENCDLNDAVMRHVLRRPPFSLYAVDFDELPGKGVSYSGSAFPGQDDYRKNTGMCICHDRELREPRFAFDSQWDRFVLWLHEGEFAAYTIQAKGAVACRIQYAASAPSVLEISAGNERAAVELTAEGSHASAPLSLPNREGASAIKISMKRGAAQIKKITFCPPSAD